MSLETWGFVPSLSAQAASDLERTEQVPNLGSKAQLSGRMYAVLGIKRASSATAQPGEAIGMAARPEVRVHQGEIATFRGCGVTMTVQSFGNVGDLYSSQEMSTQTVVTYSTLDPVQLGHVGNQHPSDLNFSLPFHIL